LLNSSFRVFPLQTGFYATSSSLLLIQNSNFIPPNQTTTIANEPASTILSLVATTSAYGRLRHKMGTYIYPPGTDTRNSQFILYAFQDSVNASWTINDKNSTPVRLQLYANAPHTDLWKSVGDNVTVPVNGSHVSPSTAQA